MSKFWNSESKTCDIKMCDMSANIDETSVLNMFFRFHFIVLEPTNIFADKKYFKKNKQAEVVHYIKPTYIY